MTRFHSVYLRWLAVMLLFWLLANFAGVVRPMGLKLFRYTGFPFTIAAWGFGIEEYFDWKALSLNVLVAAASSTVVAWLCSRLR